MMMTLKNKIKDIAVLLVLIAMLIVGSKYDYKISDNIYIGNNWINYFIAIIAKIPVYLISMYACVNLFLLARVKENKKMAYFMMAIYFVGGIICGTLMLEDFIQIFVDSILRYVIGAVLSCGIFAYIYYSILKVDIAKITSNKKEFISIIISIAIIVVLTFLFKFLIDRTRFADLLMRQGSFTQWYTKGTGGDSFPSGHVASAMALFCIIPYMKKHNWYKKDWVAYLGISLYALCVGLSRISFGMHYLSDVAFAGIIAFCVSKIVEWILYGFNENNSEIAKGSLLDKI